MELRQPVFDIGGTLLTGRRGETQQRPAQGRRTYGSSCRLRLRISSGIRSDNVAYLKGWLEKIRAEPAFIFLVLNDVRQVVRFFGERLGMQLFSDMHADEIAG